MAQMAEFLDFGAMRYKRPEFGEGLKMFQHAEKQPSTVGGFYPFSRIWPIDFAAQLGLET